MSVYDENRRKCSRCGKLVNHWETNKCDDGICTPYSFKVKDNSFQDELTDRFANMVHADELSSGKVSKQIIKMTSPRQLHDYASTLLSNAVGDWIKDKNDVILFKQVEYAKALRMAANHIDGIQGND